MAGEVKEKNRTGMSVAALTLGIVSIVSIVFGLFWYICIPTGILAIVFGAKTAREIGSKLGKAGLITGIIGLSICAFLYISMVLLILIAM